MKATRTSAIVLFLRRLFAGRQGQTGLLFAVMLVLSSALSAGAEGSDLKAVSPAEAKAMDGESWKTMVGEIKAETKALLEENEKLNAEYEFLRQKLSGMKDSLETLKKAVEKQESENKSFKVVHEEQSKKDSSLKDQVTVLDDEVKAIQSENEDLQRKLADVEEKNKLWDVQAASLENQKQEAAMDVKIDEAKQEEALRGEAAAVQELQEQLTKFQKEDEQLSQTIAELTQEQQSLVKGIEEGKTQNRELEDKVARLRRQTETKRLENERKRQELKKRIDPALRVPPDLIQEKQRLEVEVANLSSQLESLNKSAVESNSVLARKRELMNQIMRLDAENQELRNTIADLTNRIQKLPKASP